jgi:hypothetical protein
MRKCLSPYVADGYASVPPCRSSYRGLYSATDRAFRETNKSFDCYNFDVQNKQADVDKNWGADAELRHRIIPLLVIFRLNVKTDGRGDRLL